MNASSPTVKVYSTSWCVYCRMAKEYLKSKGVTFQEVNIEEDQTAAQYIMSKTGTAGVPVLEIGDEIILGFDRERIDGALRDKNLVR